MVNSIYGRRGKLVRPILIHDYSKISKENLEQMKTERARRIRDWVMLNRVDAPDEDGPFDIDRYRRRTATFQAFVKERVSSPAGELLFDSQEYLWTTNPFLQGLMKTQRQYLVKYFRKHNKKLYYLSMTPALLIYATFVFSSLLASYLNYGTSLPSWVKFSCVVVFFLALWFGSLRISGKIEDRLFCAGGKDKENDQFDTRWHYTKEAFNEQKYPQQWAAARYAGYNDDLHTGFYAGFGPYGRDVTAWDGKSSHEWKSVGKDKFIIVDKATGKEPPLLPESKPYNV